MLTFKQTIVIISVIIGILMLVSHFIYENFSNSGLALSDEDCQKLAYIYHQPSNSHHDKLICGHDRRSKVYLPTGNYETGGILFH